MNDLPLIKAHAYGNDFLYVRERELGGLDPVRLARRLCERHRGAGADGLIVYEPTPEGARMRLINADGSAAELSGNGLRALAALVIRDRGNPSQVVAGAEVTIETAAGPRFLTLVERNDPRFTFRAWMGEPSDVRQETIEAGGEPLVVSAFAIGNPQCVVLGDLPDDDRFARVGPALERHTRFPEGTNVEFAHVVASDRVEIRIWERGVGPTESSGTGACAAAIAAIAHGGAARALEVVAPGGSQQVEWKSDGVWLTGWAEILWEGRWLADV
jgi:diaminopimelate epimerase